MGDQEQEQPGLPAEVMRVDQMVRLDLATTIITAQGGVVPGHVSSQGLTRLKAQEIAEIVPLLAEMVLGNKAE